MAEFTWEALNGIACVETGKKRRNGKPANALIANAVVAFSEADAKALAKKYGLKFVKRRGSTVKRHGAGEKTVPEGKVRG